MSSGRYMSCAILDDGTMKCWGFNSYGMLGDGTQATRNTPVAMLSSSDGIFDIAKGQARGATAHVTKIPPENVLRQLIFNHTSKRQAA